MRPISLAVDVTNYVMLETGRPIHGYDGDRLQGPLVVRRARGGRAADHPRRHRPRALDRGPRRHRRLRRDRARRRDGWRDHRDVRRDHHGRGRGGPLGPGLDVPHRQAPQAHLRGRQAQRARRRPDHLRGRGRPGGRAADDVRRRHGRPGRHRGRHPARARGRSRWPRALPGRVAGLAIEGDQRASSACTAIGCEVAGRRRAHRHPAAVATRPATTPTTSSRRSSGSSATTRCRRCCRPRPPAAA